MTYMHNDFDPPPLICLLQAALNNPIEMSRLLQQPEKIREIMKDISARQWLFEQAYQTDDPNRANRTKNFIVTMMKSSRLIWQGGISPDVYDEALSRTWVWFLKDFGEYNPEMASFVTWFNRRLRGMFWDIIRERAKEQKRRLDSIADEEDNKWIDPPAPEPERWYETIQEWLELVRNNSHLFLNCRMQSHPHVNCQVLLIQILNVLHDSGEFSWENLAQNYEVEPSALRRFCKTRCFSCFKQLLSE